VAAVREGGADAILAAFYIPPPNAFDRLRQAAMPRRVFPFEWSRRPAHDCRKLSIDDVAWGPSGLVPAVFQDAADGRVLMVAYVDAEALAATLATGEVHFHSRSRDRLWRKGETSGNVLRLRDLAIDCDGDALLISADPIVLPAIGHTQLLRRAGCHSRVPAAAQARCGFHRSLRPGLGQWPTLTAAPQGFEWLETLWNTIDARARADPALLYRPASDGWRGRARAEGRRRGDGSANGR